MAKAPLRTQPGRLENSRMNKREASVLGLFSKQIQLVEYDFSKDGGAIGDVDFGVKLPANAVVSEIYFDTLTAVTSGGLADFKLKAGSTDLTAAIDFDDATNGIDSAGVKKLSALASSATAIKLSASEELKFEIITAALTAGRVRFCVEFYISE